MKKLYIISRYLLILILLLGGQSLLFEVFAVDTNKSVGQISYQTNVSPQGALSYVVPISCPSVPSGFQPGISLLYNSMSQERVAGIGWSIGGISTINKVNQTKYYDGKVESLLKEVEAFNIDGIRLVKQSDSDWLMTEQGNILVKKKFSNSKSLIGFDVLYPNGNKATYGSTDYQPLEFYPVTRMEDKYGNYIEYKYTQDYFQIGDLEPVRSGIYYISEILYGANKENEHYASIKFIYDNDKRKDMGIVFRGNIPYYENRLLKEVRSYYKGSLFRTYKLDHEFNNINNINTLTRIDCLIDDQELNPLQFTYGSNKEDKLEIVKHKLLNFPTKIDSTKLILPIKFLSSKPSNGFVYMPSVSTFDFYSNLTANGNRYANGRGTGRYTANSSSRDVTNIESRARGNDIAYIYTDITDLSQAPVEISISDGSITQGNKLIFSIFRGLLPIDYKGTRDKLLLRIIEGNRRENEFNDHSSIISNPDPDLATLVFEGFDSDGMRVDSFQFSFPEAPVILENPLGKTKGSISKSYLVGDFLGDGYESVLCITHNKDINGKERESRAILIDLNKKKVIYNQVCLGIGIEDILQVGDFDGDGKNDIYHIHKLGTDVYKFDPDAGLVKLVEPLIYLFSPKLPETNTSTGEYDDRILFADIDGDGDTDILSTETMSGGSKSWIVYKSTSSGISNIFLDVKSEPLPFNPDNEYFLQDINGDGLPDFVVRDKSGQVFIHENIDGHSFNHKSKTIPDKFDLLSELIITRVIDANKIHPIMGLVDGELALMSSSINRQVNRLMSSSINSYGVETKYEYGNLLDENVCSIDLTKEFSFPYNSFVEDMYVVNQVKTVYGDQVVESKTYKYDTPVLHRLGLGFRGFSKFSIKDDLAGQTASQEFDPVNFGALLHATSPTATVRSKYKVQLAENKSVKILLEEQVSKDLLKGTETRTTIDLYDAYGNPKNQTIDYGEGIKATTTYEYINQDNPNQGIYQLGIPKSEIRTNTRNGQSVSNKSVLEYNSIYLPTSLKEYYDNNLVSEASYIYYDNYDLKETKKRVFESPDSLSTSFEYDNIGRKIKETDPLGFTTEYVYKDGFLKEIKNHKGHTIKYDYDSWGRNTLTTYADGTTKSVDVKWDSSIPNSLYSVVTKETGNPDTKTYYDALGREIRSGSQRFDGSLLYTDQVYDQLGRVEKTSLPFKGASPTLWNTYTYDFYNRPLSVSYASGKQDQFYYNKLQTTSVIDGVTTLKEVDVTGQTIRVEDASGDILYKLRADGQPDTIVAPGGIETILEYDKYGRQTAIHDPSAGTKTFGYDNKGNIEKETDARGKTISYVFDKYNRLENKTVEDQFSTTYKYNADNLLENEISTNGTSRAYQYDEYFRPFKQKESIVDGKWLESTLTYRPDGNVGTIQYTSQSGNLVTEKYEYINGTHTELKINDTQSVWKLTAENDLGMAIQSQTGVVKRTYEYDQYGLPLRRALSVDNTYIQDFGYEFDALTGNLKWRKDRTRDITENFSYDILNRLTDFGDNTIGYDKKGNITHHSQIGTFAYNNTKPYAIEKVAPYGEDIPMRQQQISYNTQMRPESISENGYVATFDYTTAGDRMKMHIKKNDKDFLIRYYLSGFYEIEKDSIGKMTERLYLGGGAYTAAAVLIKEGTSNKLNYIGRDYLGSITHVIDETGVVIQELSYDAWGRFRDPKRQKVHSFETEIYPILGWRGYTGHEHLPMFGLINMNARLYDPVVGRFLSPDPYVQAPDLSQNFNRYSYVLNNPLRYNDLTGEWIGLDDLLVAGASFIAGYVGHGISTGNWGMGAVTSGLTSAATGWLAYNTAGLANANGAITGSTWQHVGSIGVNTVASQFMPSYSIPLGDFSIGLSPTIGLGTGGLNLGSAIGVGYNDGNFSMSGSLGFGANGLNSKSGYTGWSTSAMYKGYGVGYGRTSYSKSEINGNQLGGQVVGTITGYFNYNSFAFSNDRFGDGEDRWRSNAVELTLGNYTIGTNLYTNWGKDASGGPKGTHNEKAPIFGLNKKEAWNNGQVYSAPLWIGYKKGNQITRIGFSHSMVQNFTQNAVHKYATPTPYFLGYDNFKSGGYIYSGAYNPFSLW